jgi:hypothetical protein
MIKAEYHSNWVMKPTRVPGSGNIESETDRAAHPASTSTARDAMDSSNASGEQIRYFDISFAKISTMKSADIILKLYGWLFLIVR